MSRAGLLQVRDALALCGRADPARLGAQLNLSDAMARAMLEQLVSMGHAERIELGEGENTGTCGGCRRCPQNRQAGQTGYRLSGPNR